jgi:hypothetical protein
MPAMADFAAARERHLRRMKAFRLELPPRFNFARDVVGRHAQDPERPALLWRNAAGAERRFRYADLAGRRIGLRMHCAGRTSRAQIRCSCCCRGFRSGTSP